MIEMTTPSQSRQFHQLSSSTFFPSSAYVGTPIDVLSSFLNAVAAMSRCEAPFVRVVGDLIGSSLCCPPHICPHQLKMATGTLCFHLGKAVWSYHDVAPSKTVGKLSITVISSLVLRVIYGPPRPKIYSWWTGTDCVRWMLV